jgi:hypothetical protein
MKGKVMSTQANVERIRDINDQLRKNPSKLPFWSFRILRTQGVDSLSDEDLREVMQMVRSFNDFSEDNDPHGEHDFGSFTHKGVKYFWKIDYYAPDLMHGSDDPADVTRTVRVLTVMRADEY